jgi:hypothetical protein
MANKSLVPVALALIVGAVAVLLVHPPRKPLTVWVIQVGDASGPDDPSHLSLGDLDMQRTDQVEWRAYKATNLLYIEFEQQIFQNMTYEPATKRYRVRCSGAVCDSGALLSTAKDNVWYKYWQGLATSNNSAIVWADGRIIINKGS